MDDISKSGACIKIFSKSGRDSTSDRIGIHRVLRDSLELDTSGCKIKKQCILEGELLVWNNDDGRIEPFHKIRKYVNRSGRFLGTARDSPVELNEHLMIMFYDILLLDDTAYVRESHDERRRLLQSLVHCIPGRADVGSREVLEFSSSDAAERLSEAFARAITERWEGLVLKGCDDPYFSFVEDRSFIKLKKDYIPGLGDTADFVIVGGHWDAVDAQELRIGKLRWTSFYIGCMENKDEVCRSNGKPRFRIIDIVDKHGISKEDLIYLNRHGYFRQVPFAVVIPEFDVALDPGRRLQPVDLFREPFTVELVGAGFAKPANARDTISFKELQEMAKRCVEMPDDQEQEERNWLRRLGGYEQAVERSRTSSPSDDDSVSVADVYADCLDCSVVALDLRIQESYSSGAEMSLLIPHSPGLEKLKRSFGTRLFDDISGELCMNIVNFSYEATRLYLAFKTMKFPPHQAEEAIQQIITTAGRYTLLLGKHESTSPTIISDIGRRNVEQQWDRLAITANCCQYSTRLDTRGLRQKEQSISLSMLDLWLLNGEIFCNKRVAGLLSQITVLEFVASHSFKDFYAPMNRYSLSFNKRPSK
ncbi:hypothetical protein S7711_09756 [Stachybotrys chartarum IBT 7711]|uniref:ATP-dependent DNA ligase family profile domain-containing protein n=1 Tax=Stachybotrys chartarum (strain CBS 109288 / IBT 7711) TaxID=1280523 RepID=A0A084B2V9_STACB|nr:hypothetical protein S7711_09756 [Stachybotrys chartarum IBT 7711]